MSQRLFLLPMFHVLLVVFASPALAQDAVDFDTQILPILQDRCYECHGPERQRGEYRLDSLQGMLKGGEMGTSLEPGNADESNLAIRIDLPEDDIDIMPPRGDKLTEEQIALIKAWINQGAEYGAGGPVIVPEADPEALSALHQIDALAMPLARDTNLGNVDFRASADAIGDSQLERLQPVAEQLAWLNLSNTRITDEGLRNFGNFVNLTRLSLDNTPVTDAGLAHLKDLKSLVYLNLYKAENVT
ncbi:MAG: c-type cytochrome domain-containing protein, partial [Phycisphaeraceae bacterium]